MKRKIYLAVLVICSVLALGGCAGHNLKDYQGTTPVLDLEAYFTGPLKAWGMVQDRSGKVIRRFDVVLEGKWENGVGVLDEYFDYYRKRHGLWKMYGLNLPDEVLKKLYYKNALKLFPTIDKNLFE